MEESLHLTETDMNDFNCHMMTKERIIKDVDECYNICDDKQQWDNSKFVDISSSFPMNHAFKLSDNPDIYQNDPN